MRQSASLNIPTLPMLLPGIEIKTSATDFRPVERMQLMRFDGVAWVLFGDVIGK
jgi:branched-chain amino acid transport system substrate-binding protein